MKTQIGGSENVNDFGEIIAPFIRHLFPSTDNINRINKHTLKQLFENSSKIGIYNDALSKRIRSNPTFSCKKPTINLRKKKVTTTSFPSTTQIA